MDTLTAQRDAIYDEVRELRAGPRANGTISVIDAPGRRCRVGDDRRTGGGGRRVAEPADRGEQARA